MITDDFCAFILTHGRSDRVITYDTLRKHGYTGKIYIVIDNEDDQADEYHKRFGDKVLMFDKIGVADSMDEGDNFGDRRAIIYARNVCFELARKVRVKYFIELDDDYKNFCYKYTSRMEYRERPISNLDSIISSLLKFFITSGATSIAMAQCGDFLGGDANGITYSIWRQRKCMNSFICSTDRPFKFFGKINEDVNTYTNLGGRGGLFFTIPTIALHQLGTQKNKGGMTSIYIDGGTYIKSFYTVMYSPSCVKVTAMGEQHRRLHHRVSWKQAVPAIIGEEHKKR